MTWVIVQVCNDFDPTRGDDSDDEDDSTTTINDDDDDDAEEDSSASDEEDLEVGIPMRSYNRSDRGSSLIVRHVGRTAG